MDEQRIDEIRAGLEADKAQTENQLHEYGAAIGDDHIEVPVDEGFADSGQATAQRSQALTMIEQLQSAHAEVVAALTRIDEGNYGRCEKCDQEINPERLEAIPTARLCVECKQALAG